VVCAVLPAYQTFRHVYMQSQSQHLVRRRFYHDTYWLAFVVKSYFLRFIIYNVCYSAMLSVRLSQLQWGSLLRVWQCGFYLQYFIIAPLEIVTVVIILWQHISWSALSGMIALILMLPFEGVFGHLFALFRYVDRSDIFIAERMDGCDLITGYVISILLIFK